MAIFNHKSKIFGKAKNYLLKIIGGAKAPPAPPAPRSLVTLITEAEGIPKISYCCQGCQDGLRSPQSLSPNHVKAGTPERVGAGGQAPILPFFQEGQRGQECPFNGAIYFFNNIQFDIMTTMNLTLKLNNHRNWHWSYPNMQKRALFTSV